MAITAFPIQTQTLFDRDNTWTGANSFTGFVTVGTGVSVLNADEQPLLVSVLHGSVASPATERRPTIAVSRREAITADATGGQNAAVYANVYSNNVSVLGSNPQTNGITAKITANGAGDACALYSSVDMFGSGRAYGAFFHVNAAGTAGCHGNEIGIDNNNGTNGFVAFPSSTETIGLNLEAGGANRHAVAINIASDPGGTWDGGIRFGARINTLMYAGSWLNAVNGIDISAATFSGSQIKLALGTSLKNAANDAAAAGLGVVVGEVYRNGSVLMVRVA